LPLNKGPVFGRKRPLKRRVFIRQGLSLAFFVLFSGPALRAADTGTGNSGEISRGTAGEASLPLIARLESGDPLFKQYLADVETARRRLFTRERAGDAPETLAESLTIYRYAPLEGDDIFAIAARCNIPYAGIASLNRIGHPSSLDGGAKGMDGAAGGKTILLPSMPGIFVPQEAEADLEQLLSSGRLARREEEAVPVTIGRGGRKELYWFYPGADFTPTERIFFLNSGFRFPLRSYRLTSSYGPRLNPVTGNLRIHQGLDLAAPEGTDVFAAGDGVVTETGGDPVYGNYIIIKHGDNWASLYGHLSKIEQAAALHREVRSGTLIGKVGSTGQSTGPHLHFELRRNGRAQDPGKYLFK
jgi:murein DD-endopeptidase MepM/ murein hydrolase activator NlpD